MIDLIKKEVRQQIFEIANILNNVGERVEGNLICDVSSDNFIDDVNKNKIYNLLKLAESKSKICEIGVNAGHSLLLMVSVNPNAEYLIFDLGAHSYTRPCVNYIKEQYPQTKITEIYGDTKITLREYAKTKTYDMVHIDGGHDTHTVVNDFIYTQQLLKNNGIVIFDDYNYHNIKEVIDYYIDKKIISEYQKDLIKTDLHYIYTMNND
jgi:predicted O-methyltransferase YrrM